MIKTNFTELVGCKVPVQQAAMGGAASPELASAVSNAGALGMLGLGTGVTLATFRQRVAQTKAGTSRPFGVNFLVSEDIDEEYYVVAAQSARVVEFFYGKPDPALVALVHTHGALVAWQVGSLEEAILAADARCDFIIAQGVEAGGHVRGTIGVLALLSEVLDAVDVPVLAAGGVGDGRALAAVLAAGADGARVGTRFLAATECGVHPAIVDALLPARAQDTVYTEAFSANWPDAPHRVLKSCILAAQAHDGDLLGEREGWDGEIYPVRKWHALMADRSTTGAIAAMPHWAGESVGGIKRRQSAAEIITEMMTEAERLLRTHRLG